MSWSCGEAVSAWDPGGKLGEGRSSCELLRNLNKAKTLGLSETRAMFMNCSVGLILFYHYFSFFLGVCYCMRARIWKKNQRPNPEEPVNKAKQLTHEPALKEKGRGRCFSFCDELLTETQFAICLWESPRRRFWRTAHGVPHCSPSKPFFSMESWSCCESTTCWKSATLVLGKSEARCLVCAPYVPLCTVGTASASLPHRCFAGAILIIIIY